VSSLPAWIWPLDDSNLIAQVSPGWDVVNDLPQDLFSCRIDGVTGTVSDLDSDSLVDVVFDINSEDLAGLAAFANGGSFPIMNVDPTVAASLPKVDSTSLPPGTGAMAQIVNGLILVTWSDGTLIGLPENGPRWPSEATAAAEVTPEPGEVLWTAPAPEGAGMEWYQPLLTDGRLFRTFLDAVLTPQGQTIDTETGPVQPQVQAIDSETGSVLWEQSIDINGQLLATHDDLLLITGQTTGSSESPALLLALDPETGEEIWRAPLSQSPVAMTVAEDRVLVLGSDNQLEAIEPDTGKTIYSSDIADESRPRAGVDRIHFELVSETSLAVVDDTLVAVLADGSLAGVDIASGTVKWWSIRERPGNAYVHSVDGSLVVLDGGDLEAVMEYETSFGTPVPDATPIFSANIPPAPCLDDIAAATAVVGDDRTMPVPKTIMRLDPATGEVLWSVVSSRLVPQLIPDGSSLLYRTYVREDWPFWPVEWPVCSIEAATGQVSQFETPDDVADLTFVAAFASTPDLVLRVGVVDGELLWMPAPLESTTTEPDIVFNDVASGDVPWLEVYDGALYVSTEDGSLMKIQLPSS
jgi:outer membrane protein assembly factor BamB